MNCDVRRSIESSGVSRVITAGLLVFGSLFSPLAQSVHAQERIVTGTVTYNPMMNDCLREDCSRDLRLTRDRDWVPPVIAVNVVAKDGDGNRYDVSKTDRQGNYEISVPASGASLVFLCIGFERVEIPVDGRNSVDLRLIPTPLPKIERLVGLIQQAIEDEVYWNLDELALAANVDRYLARDTTLLIIGHRRMAQAYPGEFIPDYRFDD